MKTVRSLMDLRGRVALITGGTGAIGSAFGRTLAELGCGVAILDRDEDATRAAAETLKCEHIVPACGLACDLADEAQVRQVPERVVSELGRLDILVNNAAFVGMSRLEGWAVPFAKQSVDTWRLALEVNLTAAFVLTQASEPILRTGGYGSVVNIGSIYGMVGPDWQLYEGTPLGNPAAYAASKGGLLQLTRWLATTLAPAIRVNSITPGGVWRNQPKAFHQRYVERTPLQRMATEEDLKGALAYLASDLSAYVTGQNLIVDGGWTTW